MANRKRTVQKRTGQKYSSAKKSNSKNEILPHPFAKLAASQDYFYFDLNYICQDLKLTRGTCEEAQELIRRGSVRLTKVVCGYPASINGAGSLPMLQASGTVEAGGETHAITVYVKSEGEVSCECHCPDCYFLRFSFYTDETAMCVHSWAILFLLEDYILKYNPGDSTQASAVRMFQDYRLSRHSSLSSGSPEEKETLHLEPRLENTGEILDASFRVGTNRLYVIKNLNEFVNQTDQGNTVRYGKSTLIDYSNCLPDEISQQYLDFIRDTVREERRQENYREGRHTDSLPFDHPLLKGKIPLIGARLDQFYDLIREQSVEYTDVLSSRSSRKNFLACREASPSLALTVRSSSDSQNRFDGVTVSGQFPPYFEGAKGYYRVSPEGYLEKISPEEMRPLLPLSRQCDPDGSLSFHVGRKYLSEFYYSLLPILKEYGEVREPDAEVIESYLGPEVTFRFYLDALDGNILCKPVAVYGERTFSVTDVFDDDQWRKRPEWRDMSREEEIAETLLNYLPAIDQEGGLLHCDGEEDAVFRMLSEGVNTLMTLGEVQSTDRFRRLRIRPVPRISVGVSLESELMELSISTEDMSLEDLLAVLSSYRRKQKYFRLRSGDFVRADDPTVEALAQMMDSLRISPKEFVKGKMQIPAYRALYLDRMLEENSGIYKRRDSHFRQLVKEFKTVEDSDFEVPESLSETLRTYQVTGYRWIRTLAEYGFGGILADDMGLGKTIQMLSAFVAWKEEAQKTQNPGTEEDGPEADGPFLVVCPASLLYNWQEEAARFAPGLSVELIVGSKQDRKELLEHYGEYDVLVTSYDALKRDIPLYEDLHFTCEVLDEAQFIKNHTTAAAKSVKLIHSRYRFALTGTPIENRLSELWSIFDYLMPGFLYEYSVFRKEFETPIVKNNSEEASARLRRMISPFILRRLKKDVLKDLPDKLEKVCYAKFDTPQQRLYDAQVAHMQQMLLAGDDEDFAKKRIQVLAELTKIRQICCDPSLLYEDYEEGSAKRSACLDLIHQAMEGDHKILLFSQFTSMLALLEEDLKAEGIRYYKITGQTPKKERLELVHAFNEDATPLFLISLKAGGTGLNLTGADVVIHYDPWWNTAVQNQATDRAHRIGQTHVVSVYRLIVKDSIEEKILRMQEEKEDLADAVLSGENQGLGSLSRDELLELLDVK